MGMKGDNHSLRESDCPLNFNRDAPIMDALKYVFCMYFWDLVMRDCEASRKCDINVALLLMQIPDRLRTVMHPQLLIQIGDVPLQRPLRDEQSLSHFLIGQANRKQLQDLSFPPSQV